jgi:hypothetical protein
MLKGLLIGLVFKLIQNTKEGGANPS